MEYKKTNITLSSFIVILFIGMMFIGTFNSTFSELSYMGWLSLIFILGFANLFLLSHYSTSKTINKHHLIIIILSIIFLFINLIGLVDIHSSRSFVAMFQFMALIGFFIFASLIKWNKFRINAARNIAILFILINFLFWIIQGFPIPFRSFYPNPNLIGAYILFSLFFVLMGNKKKSINLLITLLSIVLIYASEARTTYLSLALLLITYFAWPFITKNKIRFTVFITTIMTGLFLFIFIYPKLIYWSKFHVFNDFIFRYTGKNIYSGREIIWSDLINKINEKPLFGYGSGALPGDVLETGLSAHNFYLQIAFQNGYIGLFVLVALFICIWRILWINKENYIVRLSASFFIAILIYQSFEVSLTQNQLSSGIIQWFIIATGVSFAIYKNDEKI